MTKAGRAQASSASPSAPSSPGSGRRCWLTRCGATGSVLASQSSAGIDTSTGPRGGVIATWYARAIASGTSSARAGSMLHLTYGLGSSVACAECRNGSNGRIDRACWPAVTTSGVRFLNAVNRLPIAWPTPAAECRLTKAALRVAWA